MKEAEYYESLQNFPLRLNMAEDLELDTVSRSKEIALALAVIHWQTQFHGIDIELVLKSALATASDRSRAYAKAPLRDTVSTPREVYGVERSFTK